MSELDNYTGYEIAVIGMACKFPGAKNLDEFWNNLKNGVESISYLDENEIKENVSSEMSADSNYVNCKGGLIENKEMFDASFFNYSSIEATLFDPQIRIFHECVYHALNNGGYDPERYSGLIGLYGSASQNSYWQLKAYRSGLVQKLGEYASANYLNKDQMCLRVSYKLNLKGPSVQVSTTCSSSLVAIHLAVKSLLNGECDMALAGGVSIDASQPEGYVHQDGMINSKDGKCRAFDASASGTVSGQGCGVVLLKPLEDALNDNDHIYGIIKGSFVNNDGKLKLGYTTPSIDGQSTVIREAQEASEVDVESITYIEAHGTGTIIGDPIEFMALNNAFNTEKREYCAIGAVKTNIGHLDAAAGVAGFIKTMLALKNKQIPPLINFKEQNPKIDLKNSPFYINSDIKEWDVGNSTRRAGISSFGIGGTNAHIIVEEASFENTNFKDNQPYIFSISAKSKDSLINNLDEFREYVIGSKKANYNDICYTMHVGRQHFNFRYSFVIEDYNDLTTMLNSVDSDLIINSEDSLNKDIPVVFMFSGQGSQYVNMGLELYHKNVFFHTLMEECFNCLDEPNKLKEILYSSSDFDVENINNTAFAQPLLFIIEYSLSKLLMHYGVKPTVLIGHSIGEYVAACLAGVFSLKDALFIVSERGKLMQEMSEGAMISVPLKKEEITKYLSKSISLAADNSSSLCVLSGDDDAINACADKIYKEFGVECTRLKTSHAFHSHTVDLILDKFKKVFNDIEIKEPRIPIYQNYTGSISSLKLCFDVDYWCEQLRNCVKFNDSITTILDNEKALFIEVGPGTALSSFVKTHNKATNKHIVINTVRHFNNNIDDNVYLLNAISKIWTCGIDINWELFYPTKLNRVALPNYSFQKQRYWIDDTDSGRVSGNGSKKTIKRNIDEWFYVPTWEQLANNKGDTINIENDLYLLFVDEIDLHNSLNEYISKHQGRCIVVKQGNSFVEKNKFEFEINLFDIHDYNKLFKVLVTNNQIPTKIVHMLDLNNKFKSKKEYINNYYSKFFLLKSIISVNIASTINIVFLSNQVHDTLGSEKTVPEKSMFLGAIKVLNQELPNIRCQNFDMELADEEGMGNRQIDSLFSYIYDKSYKNSEVACRNDRMWIQKYTPIKLPKNENCLLKQGGVYLITGGLGQIGLQIAKYITDNYDAIAILIHRNAFPAKEIWDDIILGKNVEYKHLVDKVSKVSDIINNEGKCIIKDGVDVADIGLLEKTIAQIEQDYKIDGLFHTAGVTDNETIYRTIENADKSNCEIQFRPKIEGLQNLYEIFSQKEIDFCLITSSLSAILGGIGFTSYAAANTYMDYYVKRINKDSKFPWISLNFDGWVISQERGDIEKKSIYNNEGIEVIERVLSNTIHQNIIVSISDLNQRILNWVEMDEPEEDSSKVINSILQPRPNIGTEFIEPITEQEQILCEVFSEVLGYKGVGVNDNFFDLGGDSLLAVSILGTIHKKLESRVLIKELYEDPTVKGLAKLIDGSKKDYFSIPFAEKKEYYALSPAEERVFITTQLNKKAKNYNLPIVFKISEDVNNKDIEDLFNNLINLNENLRSSYNIINGCPIKIIHENVTVSIEDLTEKGVSGSSKNGDKLYEWIRNNAIRLFNIDRPPLMHICKFTFDEQNHLLIDYHHITSDAITDQVINRDIRKLLQKEQVSKDRLQYKDYTEWLDKFMKTEDYQKQRQFWLQSFKEKYKYTEIPTDFERPEQQNFDADTITLSIEKEFELIKNQINDLNTTIFSLFLTYINILLYKYSGNEVVIIGTETSGRRHIELNEIAGMFVGLIPLKNNVSSEFTFKELVSNVTDSTIQSLDNQDYQFNDLVKELKLAGENNLNPLFNIIFGNDRFFNNQLEKKDRQNSDSIETVPFSHVKQVSNWDIRFSIVEKQNEILLSIKYAKALFKPSTVEKFLDDLFQIINSTLHNPLMKISEIQFDHNLLKSESNTMREFDVDFSFDD